MLSKEEAQRIAAAVNAHRPDWSVASVLAVLRNERMWKIRTYRDAAIAFTWVATDTDSKKPTRVLADGPWWQAAKPIGELSTSAHIRPPADDDCDVCNLPASSPHIDHEYMARGSNGYGTPIPDPLRESIAEQMAATKLDLTAEPCAECGQPPARHTAPAYADHPHQPTQEAHDD